MVSVATVRSMSIARELKKDKPEEQFKAETLLMNQLVREYNEKPYRMYNNYSDWDDIVNSKLNLFKDLKDSYKETVVNKCLGIKDAINVLKCLVRAM